MELVSKSLFLLVIVLLPCIQASCSKDKVNQLNNLREEADMSDIQTVQANKEIVRKLYEDCLNKRNFELLGKLIAKDYSGVRGAMGPSAFAQTVRSIIEAFPDIRWTIEELIAEEDKVVVRWSWQGTHTGAFRNIFPPTQNKVTDHAIVIYELRDNQIVKAWIQSDRLKFLQQLDLIPQDLSSLPPSQNQSK